VIRFIIILLTVALCFAFFGCANFDRYNRNPFAKDSAPKYSADSNKFVIIPFNHNAEQVTYATSLSRVMMDFNLTIVDSFDVASSDTTGILPVDVLKSSPSEDSNVLSRSEQYTSEHSLSNADMNEKYVIETMFRRDSDGTVTFIRISDKNVMGVFNISPYVYKMRPQLYAALVKMKLLKGIRYF